MNGTSSSLSTVNEAGVPSARASTLFGDAVLEVASRLEGRAPSTLMAEIMGITPQLARRQQGVPRRAKRIENAAAHGEAWLWGRLQDYGLTDAEAQQLMAKRPAGLLEGLLHWMFGGNPLNPASLEVVRELEALNARVFELAAARDIDGMLAWFRAESGRRAHLFEPVDAAGCPPAPMADLAPLEEVRVRLGHLAANMLLSLLATIDHEVTARVATEQWAGCSLVGALLAPDDMRGVYSPVALMVDLVLAAGIAASDGDFPTKRPKALDVERRLAGRKRVTGTTARVINSLRRREKKLDRRALRTLMLDTKLRSAGPDQTVAEETDMLIPLLAAAHMLTALMPTPRNKKAHPVRRGWRAAYLCWWRRHAEARGLPTVPTGDPGPPAWVTFA